MARSLNGSRRTLCCRRSCQDLNASKRYLLLALSNGNLCHSCPSEQFERAVIARRHTGSKEGLLSARCASDKNFRARHKSPRGNNKELQEVVVHKPRKEEARDRSPVCTTPRNRRSYEHAQLQDVNGSPAGSEGNSTASSSSSSSEGEAQLLQLVRQQEQPMMQLPSFTSV